MSGPLDGRSVVLTGAGGAVAQHLIPALSQAGARLVLVTHRPQSEAAGGQAIQADLTDPAQAARLREVRADALIHTVGAFTAAAAPGTTPQDLRRLFAVNFETLYHAVHAVLPGMLERGQGRIVGVSAGQAARGAGAGAALYTAAKAAVAAYLKSLDAELREQGVRTTVLYPMGAVDTPRNREAGMNPQGMIDPRDLARAAVFALSSSDRGHPEELRITPAR